MSHTLTLLVLVISIILGGRRAATAQLIVVSREARALAVYAPPPQYPRAARRPGITGGGAAILDVVSRTGIVKSARMSPSTGDRDLDQAALKAFRQWRFKPGGASTVNVPIRFTMDRPTSPPVTTSPHDALYTPSPAYPAEARSKRLAGIGTFLVDVDRTSGYVTGARMLQSTGYRVLDEAALNAFRPWRFRPSTVSRVRIPIRFFMPRVVAVVYE
jgi:TonB family protein